MPRVGCTTARGSEGCCTAGQRPVQPFVPAWADQNIRRQKRNLVPRAHWKGFLKPCKSEGKEKDDAPADFALIGAAQRVEHCEIAAYTTARNLALQLRQPAIVQLLTMSLG